MKYIVTHNTEYNYDDYVSYCHNLATLRPRAYDGQQLLEYEVSISPKPSEISERIDFFGNYITRFSIHEQHKVLTVTSKSKIFREYGRYLDHFYSGQHQHISLQAALEELQVTNSANLAASQFILESPLIRKIPDEIKNYAFESFHASRSVFDTVVELMERIHRDFQFVPGFTDITTGLDEVIKSRKGVCQDFAHLAIACIRSVGLPARYVSGYIETIPPEGAEKLVGADSTHAWFSIYIPGFGWLDFDPTNNQIPANRHIVVAWGRDYYDVTPLKGVIYTNGKNKMKVAVDMNQVR